MDGIIKSTVNEYVIGSYQNTYFLIALFTWVKIAFTELFVNT
jgi:hypothetical protein